MERGLSPTMRATRARILDGASAVFQERPIPVVTVQEILERGQVSRRTFYQYFKGLDALMDALYEQFTDRLVTDVDAAIAAAEPGVEQIRAAIDAYLQFQTEHGLLAIRLQAEAIRIDSPLAPRRERTMDRLVGLVDDAMVSSTGFQLDPLIYRAMLTGIEGMVIHLQRGGSFEEDDRARLHRIGAPMVMQLLAGAQYLPQRAAPSFGF